MPCGIATACPQAGTSYDLRRQRSWNNLNGSNKDNRNSTEGYRMSCRSLACSVLYNTSLTGNPCVEHIDRFGFARPGAILTFPSGASDVHPFGGIHARDVHDRILRCSALSFSGQGLADSKKTAAAITQSRREGCYASERRPAALHCPRSLPPHVGAQNIPKYLPMPFWGGFLAITAVYGAPKTLIILSTKAPILLLVLLL